MTKELLKLAAEAKEAVSAAPIPQGANIALIERHAREMVEGHYPKHREYLVAAAYLEQAAALAASEARVASLEQVTCQCVRNAARAEAAEQSLAEARKDAERWRCLSNLAIRHWSYDRDSFSWNITVDHAPADLDAAIDALLPKGEGETS